MNGVELVCGTGFAPAEVQALGIPCGDYPLDPFDQLLTGTMGYLIARVAGTGRVAEFMQPPGGHPDEAPSAFAPDFKTQRC